MQKLHENANLGRLTAGQNMKCWNEWLQSMVALGTPKVTPCVLIVGTMNSGTLPHLFCDALEVGCRAVACVRVPKSLSAHIVSCVLSNCE